MIKSLDVPANTENLPYDKLVKKSYFKRKIINLIKCRLSFITVELPDARAVQLPEQKDFQRMWRPSQSNASAEIGTRWTISGN